MVVIFGISWYNGFVVKSFVVKNSVVKSFDVKRSVGIAVVWNDIFIQREAGWNEENFIKIKR